MKACSIVPDMTETNLDINRCNDRWQILRIQADDGTNLSGGILEVSPGRVVTRWSRMSQRVADGRKSGAEIWTEEVWTGDHHKVEMVDVLTAPSSLRRLCIDKRNTWWDLLCFRSVGGLLFECSTESISPTRFRTTWRAPEEIKIWLQD